MRVATYIRTGSPTPRRCTYDCMARRIWKKVEQNGATTLHEGYIYHGYLQIACVDLQKPFQAAKRYITWDPTQPTATRPLALQQNSVWYTYKTPDGCKGGWTCAKHAPGGREAEGRLRVKTADGCKAGWTCVDRHAPEGRGAVGRLRVKTPDGCKGGWTCAKHAPRRGEDSMGRVRINSRYYNPVDGRWTRRDPLPQQGSSLYDYILNNPINTSDYLGLQLVMPYHAAKGVPGLTNSVNINQANQAWKLMRAFLCAFRAPTIDKPSPTFLEDQYNPNDEGDITRDYKAWFEERFQNTINDAKKEFVKSINRRINDFCPCQNKPYYIPAEVLKKLGYAVDYSTVFKHGDRPYSICEYLLQIGRFSLYARNISITWSNDKKHFNGLGKFMLKI